MLSFAPPKGTDVRNASSLAWHSFKFVFMSDVIARTKRDKKGAPNAMEELIISQSFKQ